MSDHGEQKLRDEGRLLPSHRSGGCMDVIEREKTTPYCGRCGEFRFFAYELDGPTCKTCGGCGHCCTCPAPTLADILTTLDPAPPPTL